MAAGSESADAGATQQFLLARFGASTLTVNLGDSPMGTGGEISSSPAGIDCGVRLLLLLSRLLHVVARVRGRHGHPDGDAEGRLVFEGWSGDGCLGTGTCQVEMSGNVSDDQQVTANVHHSTRPMLIVLPRLEAGPGSVTSTPAGIHCGVACSDIFVDGIIGDADRARRSRRSRFSRLGGQRLSGDGELHGDDERRAARSGARFERFSISPELKGETLRAARKNIRKAHCRTGKTSGSLSKVTRGYVISQRPRAKRQLRSGSEGRRRREQRQTARCPRRPDVGVWGLVLALSAFALLVVGSAKAAPGVLDPSFGAGSGEVTTPIGTSAGADAIVVQPDGKIVAAGGVVQSDSSQDFALARYEPDGTLDPTFGSAGIVQSPRRNSERGRATAGRQDRRGRNGLELDQGRSVQHGRLARPELRQRRRRHDSGQRVRFRRKGARAAARREDRGRRRQLRRLRDAVHARPVRRERLARRDVRQRRGRHHAGRGRERLSRLPRSTA